MYDFLYVNAFEISRINKFRELENRSVVARSWRDRGMGNDCSWVWDFLLGW